MCCCVIKLVLRLLDSLLSSLCSSPFLFAYQPSQSHIFNHSSFTHPATFLSLLYLVHMPFVPPHLWHCLDPPTHRFLLFFSFIALLNITYFLSIYHMTSTRSTNQRCTSSRCPRERLWGRRSAASLQRMPTWEKTRTWPIWSKMAESCSKSPLTLRRRKLLSPSKRYNWANQTICVKLSLPSTQE